MKKRDIGLYFDDILQSIERIEKSTKDLTRDEFNLDIDIQDAVVRRIEIIGKRLNKYLEFKEQIKKLASTESILNQP